MQKTKKYCFTFLVEYKCDAWMFIRREHVFFLFCFCCVLSFVPQSIAISRVEARVQGRREGDLVQVD
uniref:Uncharacterized protein n=1 Tax=Anguilla anguilla TaxID=7936 RepID=A0A0E9X860_ANGAN